MSNDTEYLRRNTLVAKAIGARANTKAMLKQLYALKRCPNWIKDELKGIAERLEELPKELAAHRDEAPHTDFSTKRKDCCNYHSSGGGRENPCNSIPLSKVERGE